MVYDLNTDLDRERFKRRVNALYTKRSIVECKEFKPRRTDAQNKYLHCIIGEFAMQTGNTMEYVKREYFKRLCNPELFVCYVHDELAKRDIERLRSSRDLDTGEMTTAIERFRNWAAMEAGIELPDANDDKWIDYIEREMQHQKTWL
ncbi:hypothetical protein [Alistipes sp.]|uniref:hypothetical protein n=1 Tax=Alistipes sp. TaxID=1872444 RepID=UPI003AB7BB73